MASQDHWDDHQISIAPSRLHVPALKSKTFLTNRGTMFEAKAAISLKKYSGQQLGFVIYSSLTPTCTCCYRHLFEV
jgi:hypothetical protein